MLSRSEIQGSLHGVHKKMLGLSALFCMARGEPPFSEMALIGVSDILAEMAVEIENLVDEFDHTNHDESPRRNVLAP